MLAIRELRAGYGAVPVLLGVDLAVEAGEIVAVLGRNGAGKTTLMRTLIGLLPATGGSVVFDGVELANRPPYEIAARGLAYVPQGRGIFPKLTVRENLTLGTRARRDGAAAVPDAVYGYFPRLRERLDQLGGTLSGGEQQMLAIGRALAGEPRVLLLDEPSEGIQPSIVHQIGELLKEIVATTGISVVLVEQNIDFALQTATRGAVMEKGRIVREGAMAALTNDALMREFIAI